MRIDWEKLAAVFICTLFLSFPSRVLADWSTYQVNPQRFGLSMYGLANKPEAFWTSPNLSLIQSQPIVGQNGNIYTTTRNGLVALNKDGQKVWQFNHQSLSTTPILDNQGNVYVATSTCDSLVLAFSPSGEKIWQFDLKQNRTTCGYGAVNIAFSLDYSTLYIGVGNPQPYIVALNKNGTLKWQTNLNFKYPEGSALSLDGNDNIYIGTGADGFLVSLDKNGVLRWSRRFAPGVTVRLKTPLIDQSDNIYVVSTNASGGDYVMSYTSSGTLRWSYQVPNSFTFSDLAINQGSIYLAEENHLRALNSANGQLIWTFTMPRSQTVYTFSTPVVDKNGVIYSTIEGKVVAVDPSGGEKWVMSLMQYPELIGRVIIPDDNLLLVTKNQGFNGYIQSFKVKQPEKIPLIFIPGIGGSEFKVKEDTFWSAPDGHGGIFNYGYAAGEKVWLNTTQAALPGNDDYFDILRLKSDGETSEAELELNDTLVDAAYKPTVDFFLSQGYTLNKDLFIFPYDWRKDLSLTKPLLDQKINLIKGQTGATKVDIVAHSMGGLVARNYIADAQKATNVRKLIELGTPHLGSVKFLKALLYGDCLFLEVGPFCLSLAPSELKDVLQNMEGSYQLAPTQKYFNLYSGFDNEHLIPFRDDRDVDNNQITGALNYAQTKELLFNLGNNTSLFNTAEIFHQMDNFLENTNGVETTLIAGSGINTLGQIIEKNKFNFFGFKIPTKDEIKFNGDDTVPLISASLVDTLANKSLVGDSKVYYVKQSHSSLPLPGSAMNLVKNVLSNKPDLPSGVSIQPFHLNGKQLSVHSPVNLHVYDSKGNHTGPLNNGDFEINIPGSSYDELDDAKFIFLPDDGIYQIKIDGLDEGSFDFKIRDYKNDVIDKTTIYKDITVDSNTKVKVNFDTQVVEPPLLEVDENGDGFFDSSITPTSTVIGSLNDDLVAPTTKINLLGTEGLNNWYKSEVKVELVGEDEEDGFGIAKVEYSLDDGKTIHIYSEPITLSEDGVYRIKIKSTDQAGNEEVPQEITVNIDKTNPEITATATSNNMNYDSGSWTNKDVLVSFDCKDNLSEVASLTPEVTISKEGEGQKAVGECVDKAGNFSTGIFNGINIDKTVPEIVIDAAPKVLWPPNGKLVNVKITGYSTDLHLKTTQFKVEDEYAQVEPLIKKFGEIIQLQADRKGEDKDGRIYKIIVNSEDLSGNSTMKGIEIIVSHDYK